MKLEKIEKKVNKLIPSWVGDKHIPSIIRELNKTFHKSIIYFTSNRYDEEYFDHHSVIVSGQYCPRILSTIPENILITLSFPKNKKKVLITEKESENLALKIIRAIHHEYRHKHQQRQRPFLLQKPYEPKPKQNKMEAMYYGNPDELDAYKTKNRKFIHDALNVSYDVELEYTETEGTMEGDDIRE